MTIADRLLAAPSIAAVRAALGERDDVWVVGGAIRDAALGREVVDVDLAVAGEEQELARAIAHEAGGPHFELSAEFGSWRALERDRGWHVDVTRLRGAGINADLALRDVTVNAVALPLSDLGGEPLDPHGGLADLAGRTLRAVSAAAFSDDPVRVMRLARLAAGLGFDIEDETLALARAAAPGLPQSAGERQLLELRLLMEGADPLRGVEFLELAGATRSVLPEVAALQGVVQNPNHHLDVHQHTIEVLRQLVALEADLEGLAGDRATETAALLAEPLADGFTHGSALRLAALLHDIGKPATRGETGGYVTFIGHDRVGAEMITALGARLKASQRLTRHLSAITAHHLRLGFLVHERPLPRRRIYDYLRETEPVAPDVTILSAADRLAARGGGPLASPEMVAAHLDLAREMLGEALDWRVGPPRAPIRGDELAAELGIAPGPELGRLLGEVEAAVFAGEVSDREEAVALARRVAAG